MRYEKVLYPNLSSIISNSLSGDGYTARINGQFIFIDSAFINMDRCNIDINANGDIMIKPKKTKEAAFLHDYRFTLDMIKIDRFGSITFQFNSTQGLGILVFWTARDDSLNPMEAYSTHPINTNEQRVFGMFMHYIIQSARRWEGR